MLVCGRTHLRGEILVHEVPFDLLYPLREGNTERLEQGGTQIDSVLGTSFAFITSLAVLTDASGFVRDLHPLVAVSTAAVDKVGDGHHGLTVGIGVTAGTESDLVVSSLAVMGDSLLDSRFVCHGGRDHRGGEQTQDSGEECKA